MPDEGTVGGKGIEASGLAQRVFRDAPVLILVLDLEGKIGRVNPFFEELTGYRLAEVQGRDWFDTFLPERDRERLRAVFARSLAGDHVRGHVNPILTRGGEEREIEWTDEYHRDAAGQISGILAIGRDVTLRRRAEEALRASEARYRAIVAALPDLIFRLDGEGRFLDVAATDPSSLAVPPEGFLGKTIEETFGALPSGPASFSDVRAFIDQANAAIFRALQTGALQRLEYDYRKQRFEARVIRCSEREVLVIASDITDLVRTEARLRKALEARDNLLAVVSHDLRNSLSAVLTGVQLMQRAPVEAVRVAADRQLALIRRAGERMNHLLEDLLQAATIEAGTFTVEQALEEIAPICEEALQGLEPVASAKRIRLEGALAPDLPRIACDRLRLLQVLTNLIGNALKFTPPEGSVALRVWTEEGELHFAVSDDGPGIDSEAMEHLFERYGRGASQRQGGAGLGLYISRGIVDAHGGRIWVESRVGAGSTFHFTLPIDPAPRG